MRWAPIDMALTPWALQLDGYDPKEEGKREALTTLANGYLAVRGAGSEAEADGVHYPGTHLAGGYDRATSHLPGQSVEHEDLVNLPNWLPLRFCPEGGEWFSPDRAELLVYRVELDLRRGILTRQVRFRHAGGRTSRIESRRLVHLAEQHLAAEEVVFTAEDWVGRVEVASAIDGTVTNAGVPRYHALEGTHLEVLEASGLGPLLFLRSRTRQSRLEVAMAVRDHAWAGEQEVLGAFALEGDELGRPTHRGTFEVAPGSPLRLERILALHTSRDRAISEPGAAARATAADAPSFTCLLRSHELAWRQLWRRFDVELETTSTEDGQTLGNLRLHVFHLLQTASPNVIELDVGVPARGLHGEAYRGHIFWDELFIFPFLNLRDPEITRALLGYRWRRLPAARRAARALGARGALFPWQSGSDGREETPHMHLNPRSGRWVRDATHLQRHVNAAVAYDFWQYHQATEDLELLADHGAEVLVEVSRFLGGLCQRCPRDGRYDIRGVMGPDEYHDAYPWADGPGLDNNGYTNVMTAWVLARTLEALGLLPEDRKEELVERLALEDAELAEWEEISRRMRVCFFDGVISQFEGYERLEELDWAAYRQRYGDIHRLDRILEAEGDSPNRYKLSKQPDALMLFYLYSFEELGQIFGRLGYGFDAELVARTIDYYMARTSHGSTLSHMVQSWVMARTHRGEAWDHFLRALRVDVADVQGGTTREGIHLGAMAGTVDLVQRGFTGLELRGDVLRFEPRLPQQVKQLGLRLHYRGQALHVTLAQEHLRIEAGRANVRPIRVAVGKNERSLEPKGAVEFRWR